MEPTSVLTFEDLILEVALKLGTATYGVNGSGPPAIPSDAHDLFIAKRTVNSALRMFYADAPAQGWRWSRPLLQVLLWPSRSDPDVTVSATGAYDATLDQTPVTASADFFYPSMEGHEVVLGTGTGRIKQVTGSTTALVSGSHASLTAGELAITANGNYTLPRFFTGEILGQITFGPNTNRGGFIEHTDEAEIRRWRQTTNQTFGLPSWVALRPVTFPWGQKRWELAVFPTPDFEVLVEFPAAVTFDTLVELDASIPTPFIHDETLRAACRAIAERDEINIPGVDWAYYTEKCLPQSMERDAQSAPPKLGYFGNPSGGGAPGIRSFRARYYHRPHVRVN